MIDDSILPGLHRLDQSSFDAVFREVFPPLLLYTEKITGSPVESEDIAMKAFITLWEAINFKKLQFNSLPQLRAYIYHTARNEAIGFIRSLKIKQRYVHHQMTMADINDHDLTEYYTLWSLLIDEIYVEIERLPEKCKEVVKLCYFSGLTRGEVAEMLQVSRHTVNNHCNYAVNKLKGVFSEKDLALFFSLLLTFFK